MTIRLKKIDSTFSKITKKQALIKRINDYECICSEMAPFYWTVRFASEYIRE